MFCLFTYLKVWRKCVTKWLVNCIAENTDFVVHEKWWVRRLNEKHTNDRMHLVLRLEWIWFLYFRFVYSMWVFAISRATEIWPTTMCLILALWLDMEASVSRPFDKPYNKKSFASQLYFLLYGVSCIPFFSDETRKKIAPNWMEWSASAGAYPKNRCNRDICAVERSLDVLWTTATRQTLFSNSRNQSRAYGIKSMAITTNTVQKITPNLFFHSLQVTMRSGNEDANFELYTSETKAKKKKTHKTELLCIVASRCRWFDFNILSLLTRAHILHFHRSFALKTFI